MKPDFISYITLNEPIKIPLSVKEALESPQRNEWQEAIERESKSLQKNNTWEIVPKPENITLLGTKWVFKTKSTDTGETKYKARLVVQGFAQNKGIDYDETFAPVARYSSIRYLLAFAVQNKMKITHLDIETAYPNGELEEDMIFI